MRNTYIECPKCLGEGLVFSEGDEATCTQCGRTGEIVLPKTPIEYLWVGLPPVYNDETAAEYRDSIIDLLHIAEKLYGESED